MKYKEYPKRKDSGVEWIGEIPEHWDVIRLKFLSNITTGEKNTEDRDDEGQYPFFVRSKIIERISTYFYDGEAILSPGEGDVGKFCEFGCRQDDPVKRGAPGVPFAVNLVKEVGFLISAG